ncbi:hypothetical protein Tco_1103216 [Tanacetum coccineum]
MTSASSFISHHFLPPSASSSSGSSSFFFFHHLRYQSIHVSLLRLRILVKVQIHLNGQLGRAGFRCSSRLFLEDPNHD